MHAKRHHTFAPLSDDARALANNDAGCDCVAAAVAAMIADMTRLPHGVVAASHAPDACDTAALYYSGGAIIYISSQRLPVRINFLALQHGYGSRTGAAAQARACKCFSFVTEAAKWSAASHRETTFVAPTA